MPAGKRSVGTEGPASPANPAAKNFTVMHKAKPYIITTVLVLVVLFVVFNLNLFGIKNIVAPTPATTS